MKLGGYRESDNVEDRRGVGPGLLIGGGGADMLDGGAGDDTLLGGLGDDLLMGGAGGMNAGAGADKAFVKKALGGSMAEVQMGQLALEKSSDDQVMWRA